MVINQPLRPVIILEKFCVYAGIPALLEFLFRLKN